MIIARYLYDWLHLYMTKIAHGSYLPCDQCGHILEVYGPRKCNVPPCIQHIPDDHRRLMTTVYKMYQNFRENHLYSFIAPCIDFLEGKVCLDESPCVIHLHQTECRRRYAEEDDCTFGCQDDTWWQNCQVQCDQEIRDEGYDTLDAYLSDFYFDLSTLSDKFIRKFSE